MNVQDDGDVRESPTRRRGGVNARLVNVLVLLGIACAVSFLALWAVPTLLQTSGRSAEDPYATGKPVPADIRQTILTDLHNADPLQRWVTDSPDGVAATYAGAQDRVMLEGVFGNPPLSDTKMRKIAVAFASGKWVVGAYTGY